MPTSNSSTFILHTYSISLLFLFTFLFFTLSHAVTLSSPSDSEIVHEIQLKFHQSTNSLHKVHILSHHGIVHLSGTVDSETECAKVVEFAAATPGVTDVDTSHLNIRDKSTSYYPDLITTAKVKGIFLSHKVYRNTTLPLVKVHVTTVNGVVYLDGEVDSSEQMNDLLLLAQSVKGVDHVVTRLVINPALTRGSNHYSP